MLEEGSKPLTWPLSVLLCDLVDFANKQMKAAAPWCKLILQLSHPYPWAARNEARQRFPPTRICKQEVQDTLRSACAYDLLQSGVCSIPLKSASVFQLWSRRKLGWVATAHPTAHGHERPVPEAAELAAPAMEGGSWRLWLVPGRHGCGYSFIDFVFVITTSPPLASSRLNHEVFPTSTESQQIRCSRVSIGWMFAGMSFVFEQPHIRVIEWYVCKCVCARVCVCTF